MINVNQAINWLSQGDSIAWNDGRFSKTDKIEKLKRFCLPGREAEEIKKITNIVKDRLESSADERQQLLKLADVIITCYHNISSTKKIVQEFERSIIRYQEEPLFKCKENHVAYQKWIKYGMPAHIYYKHPEFCTFMEESYLLSQIKVTRDVFFEIDGEAAILVNGTPMKWSEFKENFEIKHAKELFIVNKHSHQTYTYLDNGQGLQQHHPFLTGLAPISKLGASELSTIVQKASEFVRPGEEHLSTEERSRLNAERPHVIQLVTSYVKNSDSNFSELVINPKHPYLRIISGKDLPHLKIFKGDVFGVGYWWKEKLIIPFETIQGQFRSPDFWEYRSCDKRLVTNIPISHQEALDLYEFTLRYHRDGVDHGSPIAFHLFRQNCSTYARTALQVAGISVPTEMTLPEVVNEIAPEWIQKVGYSFCAFKDNAHLNLKKVSEILLPSPVKNILHWVASKISDLFQRTLASLTALGLVPIGIALGGTLGDGGRAFVPSGAPEERIEPPLKNWKNWFNLSGYTVNLPGVLQRWQCAQASTVVYHKPIKLAIVP